MGNWAGPELEDRWPRTKRDRAVLAGLVGAGNRNLEGSLNNCYLWFQGKRRWQPKSGCEKQKQKETDMIHVDCCGKSPDLPASYSRGGDAALRPESQTAMIQLPDWVWRHGNEPKAKEIHIVTPPSAEGGKTQLPCLQILIGLQGSQPHRGEPTVLLKPSCNQILGHPMHALVPTTRCSGVWTIHQ